MLTLDKDFHKWESEIEKKLEFKRRKKRKILKSDGYNNRITEDGSIGFYKISIGNCISRSFTKSNSSVLRKKHYSPIDIQTGIEKGYFIAASDRTIRYWKKWFREMRDEVIRLLKELSSASTEEIEKFLTSFLSSFTIYLVELEKLYTYLLTIICLTPLLMLCTIFSSPPKEEERSDEWIQNVLKT